VSVATAPRTLGPRIAPLFATGAARVIERNFLVYRRMWLVFATGLLEPVFYLLSIGVGVSGLVGEFTLSDGTKVGYVEFVAPAMLAASAMNGAIFDSTFNVFFRLKYEKLYDAMLSTPMRPTDIARGEVTWALLRGAVYSAAFIVVMVLMGLVHSWWMLLALPGTVVLGYAFAGAGMAFTTWMRTWQDFEYIQLAILPMFLFSGTFYPLSTYPEWLQHIVQWTPLYQGVLMMRSLSLGTVGSDCLVAAIYFAVIGSIGMWVAGRRVGHLLLK
jgi:lipooligosaccharide transport system permease protein